MKGDFTRITRHNAEEKQYSAVLMQQGRVQLDADWNEMQAIQMARAETGAEDTIGKCGAPREEAGFAISIAANDLQIDPGRYYVDGILCQNTAAAPVPYLQQPFLLGPTAFQTVLGQGNSSALVYLEVWQRHITALDDDLLREKALGGPDTTTRLQTVWQVRLLPLNQAVDAQALKQRIRKQQPLQIPAWDALTAPTPARMNARTQPRNPNSDPCLLPPSAGYQGLENQLYRVEVRDGGPRNGATVSWSRNNGAFAANIEAINGTEITVSDAGRDQASSFSVNQWVEIVSDVETLNETPTPGNLFQVDQVDQATRVITLKTAPPAVTAADLEKRHYKLRPWEQSGATATNAGVAMTNGWLALEDGIEVRFANANYTTGEYWVIPARTVNGEIEWPPFELPNTNPVAQPPEGVKHHYCPLALVSQTNNQVAVEDLRLIFPPLTDITAADVSFDDANCRPLTGSQTVQEAIDALCQRDQNGCTLVAVPGAGWESVFNNIAKGQDTQICFQVGDYPLDNTAVLADKGHIRLVGSGHGTRIMAMKAEAALRFENCQSVTVTDLHVQSGQTGQSGANRNLNGALTFCDCNSVTVENTSIRCAAGARRQATCLTVIDTCAADPVAGRSIRSTDVRIRGCDLSIGNRQTGILLVNIGRASVEDNHLRVRAKPRSLTFDRLVADRVFRAEARNLLVSGGGATTGGGAATAGTTVATVTFGGNTVRFNTAPALVNEWQRVIDREPPGAEVDTPTALLAHVRSLADRALINAGNVANVVAFRDWFRAVSRNNPAVASQGIVIAGRIAQDMRILNNTIDGVLQGVRVGLSHREARPGTPDRVGTLTIRDNRVRVLLPSVPIRERYGIFVGNCNSLMVDNNYVQLQRSRTTGRLYVEGIRVIGHLGKRAIIRHNHLDGFSGNQAAGIRLQPLNTISGPQWLVADNVASVVAQTPVRQSFNLA